MIKTLQLGGLGRKLRVVNAIPEAASLHADMLAWWEFEENDAGTTFSDSHGSNDLTTIASSSNTTSAFHNGAGLNGGSCMQRVSPTEAALIIPRSNTALDLGNTNWSYGFWSDAANPVTAGWGRLFMGRWGDGSSGNVNHHIGQSSANDYPYFSVSTTGSATAASVSAGANLGGGWNLIVAILDRTNDLIRFRMKSSTNDVNVTAAFTTALYTTANNANFALRHSVLSDSTYFSGQREWQNKMESAFVLNHAITDAEFTYLYNSQAGKTYPQLLADAGY